MKTVTSYVLTVWAILSVEFLSVYGSEATILGVPDLGAVNSGLLDPRLLAISHDPSILNRIDQRRIFTSDDMYRDLLHRTLARARKLIPKAVEHGTSKFIVSLCVADSRVYFGNKLGDRDIIGWISVQDITERKTGEPKVTVWVVPRLDKNSPFVRFWIEHAKQNNGTSMGAFIKSALDIDMADVKKDNGEQVRATLKAEDGNHHVKICMSGNVLQVEIMLLSDERVGRPGKPGIQEGVRMLKEMPRILPFWPPKRKYRN